MSHVPLLTHQLPKLPLLLYQENLTRGGGEIQEEVSFSGCTAELFASESQLPHLSAFGEYSDLDQSSSCISPHKWSTGTASLPYGCAGAW